MHPGFDFTVQFSFGTAKQSFFFLLNSAKQQLNKLLS